MILGHLRTATADGFMFKAAFEAATGRLTGWLGSRENLLDVSLDFAELRERYGSETDLAVVVMSSPAGELAVAVFPPEDSQMRRSSQELGGVGGRLLYAAVPAAAMSWLDPGVVLLSRSRGDHVDDQGEVVFVSNEKDATPKNLEAIMLGGNPWGRGFIYIGGVKVHEIRE